MSKSRKKAQIREMAKFACGQRSVVQGTGKCGMIGGRTVMRTGHGRVHYQGHIIQVKNRTICKDGHYFGETS